MNHQQRLAICELCQEKSFSPKKGIICSLTDESPKFESSCGDFREDLQMIKKKDRLDEHRENLKDNSHLIDLEGGLSWRGLVRIIKITALIISAFTALLTCSS